MATNDVVRLRLNYALLGQRCLTGFTFRYATPVADADGLEADFETNVLDEFRALQTADVSHDSITVEAVLPATAETFEQLISPALPGTAAGVTLPPQDALVLSMRTGTKGRRTRGRAYVGGLSEAQTQLGRAEAALLTAAAAFGTAMITRYGPLGTAVDYRLIVFSPEDLSFVKKNGTAAPRVGNLSTQVTAITVDDVIRSQRRRQIGRGQ